MAGHHVRRTHQNPLGNHRGVRPPSAWSSPPRDAGPSPMATGPIPTLTVKLTDGRAEHADPHRHVEVPCRASAVMRRPLTAVALVLTMLMAGCLGIGEETSNRNPLKQNAHVGHRELGTQPGIVHS